MCFVKSSKIEAVQAAAQEEKVEQHQADATLTKNSDSNKTSGYKQNFKTSAIGLTDDAQTDKKTLLGE